MAKRSSAEGKPFDICLSFAGEDRNYVDRLAHLLAVAGVRIFYDSFQRATLWGKDLYAHLDDIYQNQARFCVMFVSRHYVRKAWPSHERQSAQARAFSEGREYILPARFDDTKVPALRPTVHFVDLRATSPEELCILITEKLGPRARQDYFPPIPDRLFAKLKIRAQLRQETTAAIAHQLFLSFQRMKEPERRLVYEIFAHHCPAELPENVHITASLLSRITRMSPAKIVRLLGGIQCLGFYSSVREGHGIDINHGDEPVVVLEWHNMGVDAPGNYTGLAVEVVECATGSFCEVHAREMFLQLDFGQLASATVTADVH